MFVTDYASKAQIFSEAVILQCTALNSGCKIPSELPVTFFQLREFVISDDNILKIIRNLDPSKANGWDMISGRVIKMCNESLLIPLQLIFENCLHPGLFPDIWKRGNIVPVHKTNEKNLKENFRPISLLPIFSKIFEKLIYESLYSHLEQICKTPTNQASVEELQQLFKCSP